MLRPATNDDAQLLFDWVNQPDVLAMKAETSAPVGLENHVAWLAKRIADPETYIAIAERAGVPVGQVRFQRKGSEVHVDIYVVPGERGTGTSSHALRLASVQDRRRPLIALVRTANLASRRLFARLGFAETGDDGIFITYQLDNGAQ